VFIANALSPAQVAHISLDEAGRTAIVVVPDKQLSLAIGRGGQNARLAAKLTGWRIDIKSSSAAEAELGTLPPPISVIEAVEAPIEQPEEPAPSHVAEAVPTTPVPVQPETAEPVSESVDETPETTGIPVEPVPEEELAPEDEAPEGETLEQLLASEVFRFDEDSGKGSLSVLRFAEDILPRGGRGGKSDKGKSKKKRRTYTEEPDEPA
jgi:N utilization substance protein A